MQVKKEQRTERLPEIRLTPSEKQAVMEEYNAAHYPNRASFIRAKILDRTFSDYKLKEYEAEIAAGKMMTELSRMGNNINQIAKVLNTYKDGKMRKEELLLVGATAKLLLKIKQILSREAEI